MATVASFVVAEVTRPMSVEALAWMVGQSADGEPTFELVPVFDTGHGWRRALEGSGS